MALIYDLDENREVVVSKIKESKTQFKICTKVRDEVEFLPIWLSHLQECGFSLDEIIIFDNNSTEREVYEFYSSLPDDVLIAKFSGEMNQVHHTGMFYDIYEALCESSEYFCFIDADEFLYKVNTEEGKFIHKDIKSSLYEFLSQNKDYDVVGLSWIQKDGFNFQNPDNIVDSLYFAKPLFNSFQYKSKLKRGMFQNHILQIPFSGGNHLKIYPYFSPFILMHDKSRFPKRTIRVSIFKISRIFGLDFLYDELKPEQKNILSLAKKIVFNKNYLIKLAQDKRDYEASKYVEENIRRIEKALNLLKDGVIDNYSEIRDLSTKEKNNIKELLLLPLFSDFPILPWKEFFYFKNQVSRSKVYLEWGSGGSTLLALKYGVKFIYSAETNKEWYVKIMEKVNLLKSASIYKDVNVKVSFIDLGPTNEWGHPLTNTHYKEFHKYVLAPWIECMKDGNKPDLIFIDGRFRVACFLVSLLFADEGTEILIDDYADRPHYHIVEKYVKPESFVGRMAVFKSKKVDVTIEFLSDLLESINDPR